MLADSYGLNIFVENCADPTPYSLVALMKRCENSRVGICLDLGHANYSNASMEQWFEELGEWIGYLHLSDNTGSFDDHLCLGKGSVDWEKGNELYRKLGRVLPMTLEVGGIGSVKESIDHLKKTGFFIN